MHGLARYPAPSDRSRAWDVPEVGSTEEEERDSQKSIERWRKQREAGWIATGRICSNSAVRTTRVINEILLLHSNIIV